jgi:hypothetical protein
VQELVAAAERIRVLGSIKGSVCSPGRLLLCCCILLAFISSPSLLVSGQLRSGRSRSGMRVWMRCQMSDHVVVKCRRNVGRGTNTGNP